MFRTIYDFGANRGDNIDYYLIKADRVVAVEANSSLCAQIRDRFADQVRDGRLVVENVVIADSDYQEPVDFYLHKHNNVLSQFVRPSSADLVHFECITLPAISAASLVRRHGNPWYIKIDIEHFDHIILKSLFDAGIFPDYISAESHCVDVFATMIVNGGYSSFKLVDGMTVSSRFEQMKIFDNQKQAHISVSFPYDSAGPFGNDVPGNWMTSANFLRQLAFEDLGWKDIHASKVDSADPSEIASLNEFIVRNTSLESFLSSYYSLAPADQTSAFQALSRFLIKQKMMNLRWRLQAITRLLRGS
jgi:FkbM family methyltransferase